jgi:peptidoglycan/LPS O-acetylase OafA/YrhL
VDQDPRTHRPASGTRRFRTDIEGLRGLAVLLVVIFHARPTWLPGGFIGVDVFFVLSGYLITRLLVDELETTGSIVLPAFWARRARRLLPISALVIIATVLASWVILAPYAVRSVVTDAVVASGFFVNFRFAFQLGDYFGAQLAASSPSPLLHYWSLAVEEQFYFVWPLLLLAVSRRAANVRVAAGRAVAGVIAVSLLLSVVMTQTHPTAAFYLLPARMGELAIGGAVAIGAPVLTAAPQRLRTIGGWVGLVMIVVVAFDIDESFTFPGLLAMVPVLATALVITGGEGQQAYWPASRLLRLRPLQWLGKHSYGLYLWHWPLLVLTQARWGPLGFFETVVIVALAMGLSSLSLRVLENPVRHSTWVAARPQRGLRLGGGIIAGSIIVAVVVRVALPSFDTGVSASAPLLLTDQTVSATTTTAAASAVEQSVTSVQNIESDGETSSTIATTTSAIPTATVPLTLDRLIESVHEVLAAGAAVDTVPNNLRPSIAAAVDDKAQIYDDGCVNIGVDPEVHDCRYGASGGELTMVLFGDSHAAHWFPALHEIANDRGINFVVLTKGGCPTANVAIPTAILAQQCPIWRDAAIAHMTELQPDLIVMTASHDYPNSSEEWSAGMAETVDRVLPATTRLVMLGDNPNAKDLPSNCLSRNLFSASVCSNTRSAAISEDRVDIEYSIATQRSLEFIDTTDWFCTASTCPMMIGDILLYRDATHLSTTASEFIRPILELALFGDLGL